MNYVNGQFIAFPTLLCLDKYKIKYTDTLIYVALKSFDGSFGCFPGYEKIAERAGCSRDYVIEAIKRLEKCSLITVERSTKMLVSNKYNFPNVYGVSTFDKIPYQLLFDNNLTMNEKSVLICMRRFLNKTLVGGVRASLKEMTDKLGITYKQAYGPLKSLINKGYVTYENDPKFGKTYRYTSKIDWLFYVGRTIIPYVKTVMTLKVG